MYAMFDVAKKCWSKVRRSSMCGVTFDVAKKQTTKTGVKSGETSCIMSCLMLQRNDRSKVRRSIIHDAVFDVAKNTGIKPGETSCIMSCLMLQLLQELIQERDYYMKQAEGVVAPVPALPVSPEKHHIAVELAEIKTKLRHTRQEL